MFSFLTKQGDSGGPLVHQTSDQRMEQVIKIFKSKKLDSLYNTAISLWLTKLTVKKYLCVVFISVFRLFFKAEKQTVIETHFIRVPNVETSKEYIKSK